VPGGPGAPAGQEADRQGADAGRGEGVAERT